MSNHKKKVKRKENGAFNVFNIIDSEDENGVKVRVRTEQSEMTKENVIEIVEIAKDQLSDWKKVLNKMEDIEAEEALEAEEA